MTAAALGQAHDPLADKGVVVHDHDANRVHFEWSSPGYYSGG